MLALYTSAKNKLNINPVHYLECDVSLYIWTMIELDQDCGIDKLFQQLMNMEIQIRFP